MENIDYKCKIISTTFPFCSLRFCNTVKFVLRFALVHCLYLCFPCLFFFPGIPWFFVFSVSSPLVFSIVTFVAVYLFSFHRFAIYPVPTGLRGWANVWISIIIIIIAWYKNCVMVSRATHYGVVRVFLWFPAIYIVETSRWIGVSTRFGYAGWR